MNTTRDVCKLAFVFALCATPTLVRSQPGVPKGFHPVRGPQAGGGRLQSFLGHPSGGYYASVGSARIRYGAPRGYPGYVWGYPHYRSGFGFGFGFGWVPNSYGPIYPYWYGYGAWPAPPSYLPCDYRYSDACQCSRSHEGCDASGHQPAVTHSVPRQSLNPPPSDQNPEPPEDIDSDSPRATKLIAYQRPVRREVQNALNALRGMPPSARRRWLASARYNNFSLQERELLQRISDERPPSTPSPPFLILKKRNTRAEMHSSALVNNLP